MFSTSNAVISAPKPFRRVLQDITSHKPACVFRLNFTFLLALKCTHRGLPDSV